MIITEELSVNKFSPTDETNKVWEKTEIFKENKTRIRAEILENDEIKLTVEKLDKDDAVKISHSDTIDTALLQRLEVNRGMYNPLGYVISQLAQYGEIAKS